ncbi:MAG: DUF3108 domain-containing protein [Candidatus Omnitrophica bacterium]|nr:DUF3108 domain-containing protein [Candidatus Omnitrophota bacterium]
MKKSILIILCILLLVISISFYFNNNVGSAIQLVAKNTKINNAALVYRVYVFGIFALAKAVFEPVTIEDFGGRRVYHLQLKAAALDIFQKYLKLEALLDSYVDMDTGNPVYFKQKVISPGGEAKDKEVVYDQENLVMTIRGERRQIMPDTKDPLSAIYQIRRMNLDNLKELEMNINTNQKNYILKGAVVKKDVLMGKDKFELFVADAGIRRRDKNLYHQSKLNISLINHNKENIPILVKVFASGFYVSAKLVEIK